MIFEQKSARINSRGHNVFVATTHGLLLALVFGVLLPLGAASLRVISARIHGLWQIFAWLLAFVGISLGISMVRHIVS